MAFIPALDTAKVAITSHLDSQQVVNTTYWQTPGGWTAASLDALANAMGAWYVAHILVWLSGQFTYANTVATDISVEGGAQAIDATGSGGAGGNSSPSLPANAAYCVSIRTARTGRSGRGRNYISGIPQVHLIAPNHLADSWTAGILNGYGMLLSTPPTGSTWVIVSRFSNKVARPAALVLPVTGVLAIDNVVDSMRRRLPGRGV